MTKRIRLTAKQVLKRLANGEFAERMAYSSGAKFPDGATASGSLMHRLVRDGLVDLPAHTSVHSPYTLAKKA